MLVESPDYEATLAENAALHEQRAFYSQEESYQAAAPRVAKWRIVFIPRRGPRRGPAATRSIPTGTPIPSFLHGGVGDLLLRSGRDATPRKTIRPRLYPL